MQKFFTILLINITTLPIINLVTRIFYTLTLKRTREYFLEDARIIDIILTSDIKSANFIYGQSDFNFLILVDNDSHPKVVLTEFKQFTKRIWYTNILINTRFLPVVTKKEFKTNVLKSYFIRNCEKDQLEWPSIISQQKYNLKIGKQTTFAESHSAMQALDYYLFRDLDNNDHRAEVKNVYRSTLSLSRYYQHHIKSKKSWKKLAENLIRFDFSIFFFRNRFQKLSWQNFFGASPKLKQKKMQQELALPSNMKNYFTDIITEDFIDDIILTPSIIQNNSSQIQGKLYVDLVVNPTISRSKYFNQIENVRKGVEGLKHPKFKVKLRIVTYSLLQLLEENALYQYPLDCLYKNEISFSLNNLDYNFTPQKNFIRHASIHFLVVQFMSFRSSEQRSHLIGSKFIKSLNLIYRYYLVLAYLRDGRVEFARTEKKIREVLTPQFGDIKSTHILTEEQWFLVKAQLIFLLKNIRDELIRYDKSLKYLKF